MSQIPNTAATDHLPLIGSNTTDRSTEQAAILVLAQNNPVPFQIDFQSIPLLNIQASAQLDGEDDSAQFIYFSNDSCCFHFQPHPFIVRINA